MATHPGCMISISTARTLESAPRTPPLRLRFWDTVCERFVNDGLLVTAAAVDTPGLPRIALPHLTEGFGFRTLPGAHRHADLGTADDPSWSDNPLHRPFLIRVSDPQERYLPMSFRATAPHTDWFNPPSLLRFGNLPHGAYPLFLNPDWPLPPAFVSLTGRVWDAEVDAPASWAWVQLRLRIGTSTAIVRGLANSQGRFRVAVPRNPSPNSPTPLDPHPDLHTIPDRWTLQLSVHYQRLSTTSHPPTLCEILAQPVATPADHGRLVTRMSLCDPSRDSVYVLGSEGDDSGSIRVTGGSREV